LAVLDGVWQVSQAAFAVGMWLGISPALGAALVPEWQDTQVAPPRLLWSTLAEVHLLKLAVVFGVWQVSHAAVVGTWLADLPALGAALVPEWQVAQAMVLTTPWFMAAVQTETELWQLSHVAPAVGM